MRDVNIIFSELAQYKSRNRRQVRRSGRDSNPAADDGKLNRKDKAMKYIICDVRDTDCFTEEYDNKEEAIREADKEWDRYTTDEEKRHIVAFYVLESANPDEDAVNHFDGNFVKKYK